jgi:Tol biopolymer transport system component
VESGAQTVIDAAYFTSDGHCSTSPDGQWLLYDSYPRQGYRYLYLYNLPRQQGLTLAGLYDLPVAVTDIRCDLHPRWNRQGTGISLDATFEGFRGIYTVDLRDVMKERFGLP